MYAAVFLKTLELQMDSDFRSRAQYLINKIDYMLKHAPTPVETALRKVVGEILVKDVEKEYKEIMICLSQLELLEPNLGEFIESKIKPEISFLFQELSSHQHHNWLGMPVFKSRDMLLFLDACKKLLRQIEAKVNWLAAQPSTPPAKTVDPKEARPGWFPPFGKRS